MKMEQLKNDIKNYVDSIKEQDEHIIIEFLDEMPIGDNEIDYDYIFNSYGFCLDRDDYDFDENDLADEHEKDLLEFLKSLYSDLEDELNKFVPDWHKKETITGINGEKIYINEPDLDKIKNEMEEIVNYDNQSANCLTPSDYNFIYGTIYYHKESDTLYNLSNSYAPVPGWNCASRTYRLDVITMNDLQEILYDYNCEVIDETFIEENQLDLTIKRWK